MQKYIIECIQAAMVAKNQLLNSSAELEIIEKIATVCTSALQKSKKIILAGNGGSAADCQHIAAELVGRFEAERPGLPAIALTTDTSMLTAIANDYGYQQVFLRQLQAQGQVGDVFIGISASGNSPNVLAAMEYAKQHGIVAIGFTGQSGGKIKALADLTFCAPARNTARVQEMHIMVGHIICGLIEKQFITTEASMVVA